MTRRTFPPLLGSFPRRVFLFPTMLCNLRCAMCYSGANAPHTRALSPLGLKDYVTRIQELYAEGVREFDISGGEPLISSWLPDLVAEIKRLPDTVVDLVTNGTLVTQRGANLDRLHGLVDTVHVSFDSPDPATHDTIRGRRGAHARALEGIRDLVARGFPVVGINMVLMRSNYREVRGLLDIATCMGVRHVNLLRLLDVIPAGELADEVLGTSEYTETLDAVREWLLDGPAVTALDVTLVLPGYVGYELRPRDRRCDTPRGRLRTELDPLRGCFAFRNSLVLTSTGAITGCTALVQQPGWVTKDPGDVVGTVREAWARGQQRIKAREDLLHSQEPCGSCGAWAICRGGCPATAENYFGTPDAPDPTCARVDVDRVREVRGGVHG